MQASDYAKFATQSFVLPDICTQIRSMLDDDNSSIEEIAELVSIDPSLTAKLLKLANSSLFRFRSQVDSIAKAVNVIGGEALYNLVMAETASTAFDHFANETIDLKRFWLQSLYCALVAKHLAKIARVRGSEKFFLLGLMHNLGELIVLAKTPAKSVECEDFSASLAPWSQQQRVLGFPYSGISAEVMRLWHLPELLCHIVGNIHNEDKAVSNREIAIMHTSLRVSAAMVHEDLYDIREIANPLVMSGAGIEREHLDDAINFSRLESLQLLNIMNPKLA